MKLNLIYEEHFVHSTIYNILYSGNFQGVNFRIFWIFKLFSFRINFIHVYNHQGVVMLIRPVEPFATGINKSFDLQ